jgi:phage tail-like protein
MPTRDTPVSQFNFHVQLGTTEAGFQEVAGLGAEIHVAEYRAGNSKENSPQKITGTYKINDVTLKRGVFFNDLATFYNWWDAVRNGDQSQGMTVTIQLMDENVVSPSLVRSWTLTNARATKLTGPALMAKGADIAVEELVLICERIEQHTS